MVTILTKNLLKNKNMKKLIFLLIITFGMSNCTNDDANAVTNPFEGNWVVENVIYPDVDAKHPKLKTSNLNDITFLSEFIFTNNEYIIKNDDVVLSQGLYYYEVINGNELLNYNITLSNDGLDSIFSVQYKSNNSIILFSISEPSVIYELRK